MLRASLYRRVIVIALGASALVATSVGFFGQSFFRSSLAAEKDRSFADLGSRLILLEKMLERPELEMLERGKKALSSLERDYGDGSRLAGLSTGELAALARKEAVGNIYLIDENGIVVASSFGPDLGLDLYGLSARFTDFLKELRGQGRVFDQRLAVSTRSGSINSYQYLSPPSSPFIIEVSSSLDESFLREYGIPYAEFVALNFSAYLGKGGMGPVASFDVVSHNGSSWWSLIRPGKAHVLDSAGVLEAQRRGEYEKREGALRTYLRPVDFSMPGKDFADYLVAEFVYDLSSITRFALLTLFISLAACAAAGLLSLALARSFFDTSIVARVEALQLAMLRVASGERGVSFASEGGDELASIGKSIESMLVDIGAAEEELRNAKTAEAVGLMAGGLAHDINNLLAGAVGAASVLRARLEEEGSVPPAEILTSLELIEHTGARGDLLVRDLLALARSDRPAPRAVDLCRLASESMELVRASAPQEVHIDIDLPDEKAEILGSAEDIRRIVLNLCRNGIQAMTDMRPPEEKRGGSLRVALRSRADHCPARLSWALSVADEGVGIGPEVMTKLFTPFFSTKPRRGGSGLGLSASKAIAEAHGGRIEVTSRPEGGTIFTLVLPGACAAAVEALELPAADLA